MLNKILPEKIAKIIGAKVNMKYVNELRFRADKPIILSVSGKNYFLGENGLTSSLKEALFSSKIVIEDIVFFTSNLLKKAKLWGATFIYISSIEAYGESRSNKLLNEKEIGYLSLTNPRNAYPESKRICELLCYSYYKEYGLHTNIIRPTQTFGRFVSKSDGRVFAYIARSILSNKDVILSSDGLSSKPYISTDDLAFAIIYVILKGKVGECYNVANKDNFCSINDLFMFAKEAFNNQKVKLIHRNEKLDIYPKNTYINLDTLKLSNLGWEPKDNLINMFKQLKLYWDSIS